MEIVNLTDKPVTIVDDRGNLLKSYPPRGRAWCDIVTTVDREVDGVPIFSKSYGKVNGLPAPDVSMDTFYIIDPTVADAVRDSRFDVLLPDQPIRHKGTNYYRGLVNI